MQESFFRMGSALGGKQDPLAAAIDTFGGRALSTLTRAFAGTAPGGLTVDQYTRLHQSLTGTEQVLVQPDAQVWNQLIMNRLDAKGREKPMNATAILAPEPGSAVGHAIVIERMTQNIDGTLTAHVRDPMYPGVRTIPLALLQAQVQLIEMTPPQASTSKAYLDQVVPATTI